MKKNLSKISIVAGRLEQPRELSMFYPLVELFDVTVHAINSQGLIKENSSFTLKVYEDIEDMPGYMRDLEDHILEADLIISLETSKLSTFQALQCAKKLNKPFFTVVNEFHPNFYDSYRNIKAIQSDIHKNTTAFLASSKLAQFNLERQGIPPEKITAVSAKVDSNKFQYDESARMRFRNYCKISESEFVILYKGNLSQTSEAECTLRAVAELQKRTDHQFRVIFAGNGDHTKKLKYLSYDTGLGNQVMFLHQDPENFLVDLYCASDFIIEPNDVSTDTHTAFPLSLLEAAACGAIPVSSSRCVAAELTSKIDTVNLDGTPEGLATILARAMNSEQLFSSLKVKTRELIETSFSMHMKDDHFVNYIERTLENKTNLSAHDSEEFIQRISALIEAREAKKAFQIANTMLEQQNISNRTRSSLLVLKGDCAYQLGDLEGAMNHYTEALSKYHKNADAYRGLGFVAWKSHSNEESLTFFKKALALSPTDNMSTFGIGMIYRRIGLLDEAAFWLEKSATQPPYNSSAVVALTQTCLEFKDFNQAIEKLENLKDALGDRKNILMALGQLYLRQGDNDTGREILQRAMSVAS